METLIRKAWTPYIRKQLRRMRQSGTKHRGLCWTTAGYEVQRIKRGMTGMRQETENWILAALLCMMLIAANGWLWAETAVFRNEMEKLATQLHRERMRAITEYRELRHILIAQDAILDELGIEAGSYKKRTK